MYLLDGYNILFHFGKSEGCLESHREWLIQLLSSCHKKILLVFDAYNQEGLFSRTYQKKIEVVYTAHRQSADEFIIEMLHLREKKEPHIVVSNDRLLLQQCKS